MNWIPTRENLTKRKIALDETCPACKCGSETTFHALCGYKVLKPVCKALGELVTVKLSVACLSRLNSDESALLSASVKNSSKSELKTGVTRHLKLESVPTRRPCAANSPERHRHAPVVFLARFSGSDPTSDP
ncbi:hypothetical protein LWI28_004852 [Acer negundo]|uniref:Uncharacterized protein n=1 Tax=Acer negundo TaxID=4023 RepID=A0AAD5NU28_ACENE|nr:hypothetical protein LWI28_004852 [Acer negundo]